MLNPLRIRVRFVGFVIVLLSFLALIGTVYAVFTPLAAEFQVNDANAANLNDFRADMAMQPNGNFVIVWQGDITTSESDIFFKRYNQTGAQQGGQTLVNGATAQSEDQRYPQIAMNPTNGDFVIVWTSDDDTTAAIDYNVHYRLFNASGTPLTGDLTANTTTTGAQTDASVAMNSSGNFVVTWQSLGDGSSTGIFFQRFNSAGTAQGSETQANVATFGPQTASTVGMDNSGNFVIAWRDGAVTPATPDVTMRHFDSTGAALTGDTTVDASAGTQQDPQIAMRLSTGDFVIVWDSNASTADLQTYGRRYNSSLTAQGVAFLLPSDTSVANSVADVAMNGAGDFTITWEKDSGAGDTHAMARRYNASGTAFGTDFQVDSSGTAGRSFNTVGMSDQNDTAFAWATGPDLFARIYADRADLAITKTSNVPAYSPLSGAYVPGSPIQYTLTVTNAGPSAVVGATVTDTFTAAHTGITWACVANGSASCVSGSPSGTGASGSGNISQPVDVSSGSLVFTITANTSASASANLTNTATVTTPATTSDSNTANNSASLDLPAQPHVDVAVSKTAPAGTYTPGSTVTYTITVSASGPSAVPSISVTDLFDSAFSSVSWTCAANGTAACTSGSSGSGNINASVDVAAGGGNSVVYTVDAVIDAGSAVTSIDNTATVAVSGVTDDNSANDSSTHSVDVGVPLIEVTGNGNFISDGDTTPSISDDTDFGATNVGTPLTHTFTIINSGSADLTIASVTPPTGFTVTTPPTSPVSSGRLNTTTFDLQCDAATPNVFSGTVIITSDAGNDTTFSFDVTCIAIGVPTIAVSGNGNLIAAGDTTPSTTDDTDFGTTTLGAPVTHSFTIDNTGSADLTLTSVTPPAGFTITSPPTSPVTAGNSTTFDLQCDAASANTFSGTVTIVSDASNTPSFTFDVICLVTAAPTLPSAATAAPLLTTTSRRARPTIPTSARPLSARR